MAIIDPLQIINMNSKEDIKKTSISEPLLYDL